MQFSLATVSKTVQVICWYSLFASREMGNSPLNRPDLRFVWHWTEWVYGNFFRFGRAYAKHGPLHSSDVEDNICNCLLIMMGLLYILVFGICVYVCTVEMHCMITSCPLFLFPPFVLVPPVSEQNGNDLICLLYSTCQISLFCRSRNNSWRAWRSATIW